MALDRQEHERIRRWYKRYEYRRRRGPAEVTAWVVIGLAVWKTADLLVLLWRVIF